MSGRTYRVLVVDDEPSFFDLAREVLEGEARLEVVATVTSGEEALRQAQDLRPDLVLVDAHLRGITGFETARRMQTLLPGVRVVVLSADAEPGYRPLAAAAGALGFLTKVNLSPAALLALLGEPGSPA